MECEWTYKTFCTLKKVCVNKIKISNFSLLLWFVSLHWSTLYTILKLKKKSEYFYVIKRREKKKDCTKNSKRNIFFYFIDVYFFNLKQKIFLFSKIDRTKNISKEPNVWLIKISSLKKIFMGISRQFNLKLLRHFDN